MSEITLQTDIGADRAVVYEALNTHDGLTGWWTTGVNREGEVLLFDFPQIPETFGSAGTARTRRRSSGPRSAPSRRTGPEPSSPGG